MNTPSYLSPTSADILTRLIKAREVGFLNSEGNNLESFKPRSMQDLTEFCDAWADNIQAQQWFLNESKPNPLVTVRT